MKKTRTNYQNILFFVTVVFFMLGILHISFAAIGIVCIVLPLVLYALYKDKIWCKYYCPRAGFFSILLRKISLKKRLPKFLSGKKFKSAVVIYFAINFLFITMSTIMVSLGRITPIEQIRFLIVFGLPINLPQLLAVNAPDFLIHFGYRMYSVMFTSTVIGLLFGFIYSPRTWCVFCPIQTLTTPSTKKE